MNKLENWIGSEEVSADVVTAGLLDRYNAVLEPEGVKNKDEAPLGLHWCLCLPDCPTSDLASDGHPEKGGFLPPISLPRRMWAGSTISFHKPLGVGASVKRTSRIASITEKEGSSGLLVFVAVEHRIFADEILSIEERQTLVYREAAFEPLQLPSDSEADLSSWPIVTEVVPGAALLFRYSALTFNSHRIHYDLPYAAEQEGYPGLVVHGPLIASLLLRLASGELGQSEIASFTFRAKSPAFCDQKLFLVAKSDKGGLSMAALGSDGRMVMEASLIGK